MAKQRARWTGRRLIDCVMLFVLIAGLTKLADLAAFEDSVRTWDLLPRSAVLPIAWCVPTLELVAAGGWFLRLWPRASVGLSALMIGAFTVAFLVHLVLSRPPDCGCLGKLVHFESLDTAARVFMVRNSILLSALITGTLLCLKSSLKTARHTLAQQGMPSPSHRTSGFTLIEMVMVIALVGILTALLLPTLGIAKERAYHIDSVSDLRSHMQVLAAYSVDYDDVWPFLTDPDATYTVFRHPRAVPSELLFFQVTQVWHWPLLGTYLPEDGADMFVSAGDRPRDGGIASSYTYSSTMYSRPDFWNARTRTGPAQWRPVRVSETLFPSAKGAMYDVSEWNGPVNQRKLSIGLCDGSAAGKPWESITKGYPTGEGDWWGSFNKFGIRVMHTIDGARGRDIE